MAGMPTGSLTVICGSMFSGKTEELIRLVRRALYAKRTVQVFKPALDTRDPVTVIRSHNGARHEAQAAENNIKISVVEHENVPQIMGDPEFLRSVFNNLFINAVQSMGTEGGHLSVKIAPDNGLVRFEIADTGNGISSENLSKIFEPYFSTKETGTGLGLAIVHKIVDIHHGKIEVESIEGEGTKFTVKLPKADI